MTDVIRHIVVRGKVQGVGYRAWFAHEAEAQGLSGWVRNRKDGTVEAVLSGPDDVVSALIERSKRGPQMARVSAVDHDAAGEAMMSLRNAGQLFSVLPTL